jgi:hypothetical protein
MPFGMAQGKPFEAQGPGRAGATEFGVLFWAGGGHSQNGTVCGNLIPFLQAFGGSLLSRRDCLIPLLFNSQNG